MDCSSDFFFNDFLKETSIISDLFFGFTETTNICQYCNNYYSSQNQIVPISYNYQIFNCLIFPLEEVKNTKNNQNYGLMNNQNNMVTLIECFIYNQKTDIFTGCLNMLKMKLRNQFKNLNKEIFG